MSSAVTSFQDILTGFNFLDIEKHPDAIYGLYPDFTLAYFNPAWFGFAAANRGEPRISREWGLGRNIFDAISDELASFYSHMYKKALVTGKTCEHVYECSSSLCMRKYHQIIYPVSQQALLVVNSLVVSMPIEKNAGGPSFNEADYRDSAGMLHQCAHCRKIRSLRHEHQWDWIGYLVNYPPDHTRHCLCDQCRGYYYHLGGLPSR